MRVVAASEDVGDGAVDSAAGALVCFEDYRDWNAFSYSIVRRYSHRRQARIAGRAAAES